MKPFTNLDIYLEILRYLDVSIDWNTDEILPPDRRTIYSLALTCTPLSNLALDALWRSVDTLEPIFHVLTASSPNTSTTYHEDYRKSCSSKDMISRAQTYLSRIRTLRYIHFPSDRERALWQMLLTLGNTSLLCPNLRVLELNLEDVGDPKILNSLVALLPPSLEDLALRAGGASGEEMAFALLDICHSRDVRLHSTSYDGYLSRRIDQHFARFPDLRALHICPLNLYGGHPGLSEINTLRNLGQLTKLCIDLRCLLPDTRVDDTLSALGALTTLEFTGSWQTFSAARVVDHVFHNVTSLTLSFSPGEEEIPSTYLFSHIPLSFPNIDTLVIIMDELCRQQDKPPSLSDFQRLRDLPLQCLQLLSVHHALFTGDIVELIKTWPVLQTLWIGTPPVHGVPFNAVPILEVILSHGVHLESLDLPLDFSSSSDPSSWYQFQPSCSLHVLWLIHGPRVPETTRAKLALARALVRMFPLLEIMAQSTDKDGTDLAEMVQSDRNLLSAPPWSLEVLPFQFPIKPSYRLGHIFNHRVNRSCIRRDDL